jgi:hypothetical protein
MARGTVVRDTDVTENRGSKCRIAMTEVTVLTGWHMNRCAVLTDGPRELTIVTTGAAIGITQMNVPEKDI